MVMVSQSRQPKSLGEEVYRFDVDGSGNIGWRAKQGGRFYTSTMLVRKHVDWLLDRITQKLRETSVFPGEVR